MRRVGLRLVGRTLQAARLPPVKQAFRLLDPCGNGYITQDALAEVQFFFFFFMTCSTTQDLVILHAESMSAR